jgi:hypothetical protein
MMRDTIRRIFEEMNRAAFFGNAYRYKGGRVICEPFPSVRARLVARYCYDRMTRARA